MKRVYQWREVAVDGFLVDPKYRVSFRQLDYWSRAGYLGDGINAHPGTGVFRQWSWQQIQIALAVGALRAIGFELTRSVEIAPRLIADPDMPVRVVDDQLDISVKVIFDPPKEPVP